MRLCQNDCVIMHLLRNGEADRMCQYYRKSQESIFAKNCLLHFVSIFKFQTINDNNCNIWHPKWNVVWVSCAKLKFSIYFFSANGLA